MREAIANALIFAFVGIVTEVALVIIILQFEVTHFFSVYRHQQLILRRMHHYFNLRILRRNNKLVAVIDEGTNT